MTGNRIADKITSAGKSKEDDKTKKNTRNLNSTERKQQIIDELTLFRT